MIFFRAFKREQIFEVWQKQSGEMRFSLIASYPFQKTSGQPGPKRREGDLQIPEGLYHIDRFNPKSKFLLSLGVDYPNTSDRILGDPNVPGSDIFIHGGDSTVGCICLGDAAIQKVYPIAWECYQQEKEPIQVHIFPFRMNAANQKNFEVVFPQHAGFWKSLVPFYQHFEIHKRLPSYRIDSMGNYKLLPMETIIQSYFSALETGSAEKVLSLFSQEAVVHSPLYGVQPANQFYQSLFEDTNASQLTVHQIFTDQEKAAAAHFSYHWTLKNGKQVQFEGVDLFQFDDQNRITELRIIYDTKQVE